MSAAVAPLVPSEVDLRDFGFMPLDVDTLLSSSLWVRAKRDPRVGHAAMSLWCRCWHQVPAASLPNDDELLADFAGCDPQEWDRVKNRALANFVLCSDGRLYHRHVAAKALEAWASKIARVERTQAATRARQRQRDEQRDVERNVHQGTGTGTGTGIVKTPPNGGGRQRAADDPPAPEGKATKKRLPLCPSKQMVELYHEVLPELPRVRDIGAGRQRALRAFWAWMLTTEKDDGTPRATSADDALAYWRRYLERARRNDFVMGRTAPGNGHEKWRAGLDFLLSEKGRRQVLELTQG